MLRQVERLRDRFYLTSALHDNVRVSQLEGDRKAARDFSDRGLAVSSLDGRLLGNRVLLEYEVGEFGHGKAYLEQLLGGMRLEPSSLCFRDNLWVLGHGDTAGCLHHWRGRLVGRGRVGRRSHSGISVRSSVCRHECQDQFGTADGAAG